MTTTFIPEQYNQNTLAALIEEARLNIIHTEYSTTFGILNLLADYDARKLAGQTMNTTESRFIPIALGAMDQVDMVWNLSPAQLEALETESAGRVTAGYLESLEAQRVEAIEVMAAQMVRQKQEARDKAQAELEAKELAEATAHAITVMDDAKLQAEKLLAKAAKKLNTNKDV